MATEVTLPALGESVTEGTVTRWLKQVGDTVAVDEPLLEVSTDKVDTEIPSPVAGTLLEIKANEDETVEVGAVLAVIGDEGESGGESSDSSDPARSPSRRRVRPDESADGAEDEADAGGRGQAEEARRRAAPGRSPSEPPSEHERARGRGAASGGGGGGGESTSVTLPALGESVTEGTVTRWLKQVGDEVAVDEPLLEVSTDKVDTEIPSPVAGTLLEIKVERGRDRRGRRRAGRDRLGPAGGDTLRRRRPTHRPGSEAEEQERAEEQAPRPEPSRQPEPRAEPAPEQQPSPSRSRSPSPSRPQQPHRPDRSRQPAPAAAPSSGSRRTAPGYVTPLVRKLAAQHDVDLVDRDRHRRRRPDPQAGRPRARPRQAEAGRPAAGRGRRPRQPPRPPRRRAGRRGAPRHARSLRGTTEKISRLRKIIAERMVESLQTSAQLTTGRRGRRHQRSRGCATRRRPTSWPARASSCRSCRSSPRRRSTRSRSTRSSTRRSTPRAGEITYYDRENLAIAVDTEKGLLTPVDQGRRRPVDRRAGQEDRRRRRAHPHQQDRPRTSCPAAPSRSPTSAAAARCSTPRSSTSRRSRSSAPGRSSSAPVVIDDPNLGETIAVRQMVYLALTYDHRLVDGADAARFLSDVKQRLETGTFEV